MVMEQRPSERGVAKAKAEAWVEPKMVVGLSRGGDVVAEPWLKPKNNGSLIPPRRKLVKRMMFDSIVRFIASMFGAQRSPTSSGAPINPQGKWAFDDSSTSQPQQREECEENPSTSTMIGVAIHHHHQRRATAHDDSVS